MAGIFEVERNICFSLAGPNGFAMHLAFPSILGGVKIQKHMLDRKPENIPCSIFVEPLPASFECYTRSVEEFCRGKGEIQALKSSTTPGFECLSYNGVIISSQGTRWLQTYGLRLEQTSSSKTSPLKKKHSLALLVATRQ